MRASRAGTASLKELLGGLTRRYVLIIGCRAGLGCRMPLVLTVIIPNPKIPNAPCFHCIGGEKWFEEKLRRTREGDPFIDDESLEKALGDEWLETEDGDVGGGSGCGLDGGEEEDDDELQDWEMYDEEVPSYCLLSTVYLASLCRTEYAVCWPSVSCVLY